MEATHYNNLYQRAIDSLIKEIQAFNDSKDLWEIRPGVTNSAGNLSLHLIGNVNHFIGATLANTGYQRNRDAEFNTKDLSKEVLLEELNKAKAVVEKTLLGLSPEGLLKEYPFDFAGKSTTGFYLAFFLGHFHYHLGQVNYLRRMIAQS